MPPPNPSPTAAGNGERSPPVRGSPAASPPGASPRSSFSSGAAAAAPRPRRSQYPEGWRPAAQKRASEYNGGGNSATEQDAHQDGGNKAAVFADAEAMKARLRERMCAPQYNVMDFYHTTGIFQEIAKSRAFEKLTLMVIGANTIWIWIDTDYNKAEMLPNAEWQYQIGEHLFCMFFAFEWYVRFASFKKKRNCLRDKWFVFDSTLVFFMVLETWVMTFILLNLTGTKGGSMGNTGVMRLVRLLRLSRMARMARLLRSMPELLILIKGMLAAGRSVFFTLLLLGFVLYVFGIAFTQLLAEEEDARKGFLTVPSSMHTLLLRGVLMDDIGSTVQQLSSAHTGYVCIFYLFVLISSLTVMNMLIGVLCEVVNAVAATEREELAVTYVRSKLQETLRQGGLDQDGDGTISKHEFAQILDNAHAARTLTEVGVDVFNLVDLQDFIFETDNDSGEIVEKELTFGEFMEVVLQLRGSNGATVKDVVDLRKFVGMKTREVENRILGALNRGVSIRTETGPGGEVTERFTIAKGNDPQKEPSGVTGTNGAEGSAAWWRVPPSGRPAAVHQSASLAAVQLAAKAPGSFVRGWRCGEWVELAGEPGFVALEGAGAGADEKGDVDDGEGCGGWVEPCSGAAAGPEATLMEQLDSKLRAMREQLDAELQTLGADLAASARRLAAVASANGAAAAEAAAAARSTRPSALDSVSLKSVSLKLDEGSGRGEDCFRVSGLEARSREPQKAREREPLEAIVRKGRNLVKLE